MFEVKMTKKEHDDLYKKVLSEGEDAHKIHHDFFFQFSSPDLTNYVKRVFGERIMKCNDIHFNDGFRLSEWVDIAKFAFTHFVSKKQWKNAHNQSECIVSISEKVCIVKAVAYEIRYNNL
jgi:hypothetical protein